MLQVSKSSLANDQAIIQDLVNEQFNKHYISSFPSIRRHDSFYELGLTGRIAKWMSKAIEGEKAIIH